VKYDGGKNKKSGAIYSENIYPNLSRTVMDLFSKRALLLIKEE
jgi:hypothetical protein